MGPLYPMTFALAMSRLLSQAARFGLEKGTSLGILEQLMGSRTMGAVIATHFNLRIMNPLAVALLCTWILSPLGSQAFLRILHSIPKSSHTSVVAPETIYTAKNWDPTNVTFLAALFSDQLTLDGPMDIFGNVKIPFLTNSGFASQEWLEFQDDAKIQYSGFVGIPVGNLPLGKTEFSLETAHLKLQCRPATRHLLSPNASFVSAETVVNQIPTKETDGLDVVEVEGPLINGSWYGYQHGGSEERSIDWSLAVDRFVGEYWFDAHRKRFEERSWLYSNGLIIFQNETGIEAGLATLLFQARRCRMALDHERDGYRLVPHEVFKSECEVRQEYIESRISCSVSQKAMRPVCKATAQRPSQRVKLPETLTYLSRPSDFEGISNRIPALKSDRGEFIDPVLAYIYGLSEDYLFGGEMVIPDFATLPETNLSLGLSQVLNSYILANQIGINFNPAFFPRDESTSRWSGYDFWQFPNATTTDPDQIYAISWPWMAACFGSCLVISTAGILSVIFAHLARGPEVLGMVSTSILDSKYVDVPPDAKNTDISDLSRLMKAERLRYGYIKNQVGTIGIGVEENVTRID